MTMQRRSFLTLSTAGAAGVGMSLLGSGQAEATARAGAPTLRFAAGVRQYAWSRDRLRADATSRTTTWESALS
ncbi:twin-arginine translocation signal domain-containing protein [Streptomyces europaeiscabiei]|uniref:twin-arginine translocation signal domain-containing protein n=1 Tax=Streptomyces TaxID=1883 RepID=UPI0015C507E3|nr:MULTISPECIES: twin-arginine translocation signal domain-containing protein [Streptomyces]MDX3632224.1 twin-arginine translocation signal domain-containing protein [Streptomyces europaeiscabiei]MDX3649683.1 twin-arginine translocation signal domain-containing protein [Streptomyces europaeiscabiei]WUD37163.1 twin-arginine translocation signal domain-containing protein [Streptomyces europaeiscabiei]